MAVRRASLVALVLVGALSFAVAGQSPQPPQFRSAVSVMTVETSAFDADALKLLVSVDVGAGGSVTRPIRWGTTLVSGDKVVASAKQTIETAADAPSGDTAIVTLPPGAYLLRVAAPDAFGRGSVFQIPVAAGLKRAGLVEISDLIVGPGNSGKLRPAPRVKVDDGLIAVVQIYADEASALETVAMRLEIVRDGDTQPLTTVVMTPADGATPNARSMQARVAASSLSAGRYVATAVLLVNGEPAGRVSRAVQILP
jgi:hypothetical protein